MGMPMYEKWLRCDLVLGSKMTAIAAEHLLGIITDDNKAEEECSALEAQVEKILNADCDEGRTSDEWDGWVIRKGRGRTALKTIENFIRAVPIEDRMEELLLESMRKGYPLVHIWHTGTLAPGRVTFFKTSKEPDRLMTTTRKDLCYIEFKCSGNTFLSLKKKDVNSYIGAKLPVWILGWWKDIELWGWIGPRFQLAIADKEGVPGVSEGFVGLDKPAWCISSQERDGWSCFKKNISELEWPPKDWPECSPGGGK